MPEASSAEIRSIEKRPTFNLLRDRFNKVFAPLGLALASKPEHAQHMDHTLDPKNAANLRINLISDPDAVETVDRFSRLGSNISQKSLHRLRENSSFNAHLTAILTADGPTVSQYLNHYWEKNTANVQEQIRQGDYKYVPVLVVGAGVHGIITASEAAKRSPDIVQNQMLVVDQAHQPGGPFAVPEGPAWDLNSGNFFGPTQLADIESSFGGPRDIAQAPTRHYPGERASEGGVLRTGDINQVADYLPNLSQTTNSLYANNEEFQRLMSAQLAMLTDHVAFDTKVNSVKRTTSKNINFSGLYEVELEMTNHRTGQTTIERITTDNIIFTSGKNEPTSGLDENDPNTARVIAEGKNVPPGTFPKYAPTLEAFKSLVSRKEGVGRAALGETVVIIGNKNSMDTVVEALGALANIADESTNAQVKIKDIVIVGDLPDNCEELIVDSIKGRPRYARIANLFERQNRPNLVRVFNARAEKLRFLVEDEEKPIQSRQILVYTDRGFARSRNNDILLADNIINATGFKSDLTSTLIDIEPRLQPTTLDATTNPGKREISRLIQTNTYLPGTIFEFDPPGDYTKLIILSRTTLDKPSYNIRTISDSGAKNSILTVPELKSSLARDQKQIKKVFRPGESLDTIIVPVTIPGNPDIAIADQVAFENIYLAGTIAKPRYNEAKLDTLPEESRRVLERVGSENAVAIGFRGVDTAAFAQYFFSNQFIKGQYNEQSEPILRLRADGKEETISQIPFTIDREKNPHLMRGADWQMALLAQTAFEFEHTELLDTQGLPITQSVECDIIELKNGGFGIRFSQKTPTNITFAIKSAFTDEMIQTAIYQALNDSRKAPDNFVPRAHITLTFNKGKFAPDLSSVNRDFVPRPK